MDESTTQRKEEKFVKIDFDFWVVWVLLPIFLAVQLPGDVQAANVADPHHRTATAIQINGVTPQLDGVCVTTRYAKPRPSMKAFASATRMKENLQLNALRSRSPTMTKPSILRSYAMTVNPTKLPPV